MDKQFIALTAAGVVVLSAASSLKKKRAHKTIARTVPVNYAPLMEIIPV